MFKSFQDWSLCWSQQPSRLSNHHGTVCVVWLVWITLNANVNMLTYHDVWLVSPARWLPLSLSKLSVSFLYIYFKPTYLFFLSQSVYWSVVVLYLSLGFLAEAINFTLEYLPVWVFMYIYRNAYLLKVIPSHCY